MKKYIIKWNIGHGDSYSVVDAENNEEALKDAYDAWREDAENNADYDAEEYTEERAEELDL